MNNLDELLVVLSDVKDSPTGKFTLLSIDLNSKTATLDKFNISYEQQPEGVRVDLSNQSVRLYKTKLDAITDLEDSYFDKPILVFEEHLIYQESAVDIPVFFENILYWHKFKSLIIDNEISSYDDELANRLIFLSEHIGKVEVGYAREISNFFDEKNSLQSQFTEIKETLENNNEFASFFRDNFLKIAQDIDNVELRYTESLSSIKRIYESSKREFELYKNKFSFDVFKAELDKETESYLKEYQADLSSFLLNVGALPIQFGVYIYLITKFETQIIPLVAVLTLILIWSLFSLFSIKQILDNVKYIKGSVEMHFGSLIATSGLINNEIEPDKELILKRFSKTKSMLMFYMILVSIFSISILVMGFNLIMKLLCS